MNQPIISLSICQLASLIKNKKLSSSEVVSAFIQRIEEVNPKINALISERMTLALSEANLIDNQPDLFKDQPLRGIPFTLKEIIEVEGQPRTIGSINRLAERALEDASVTKRLKAAGGILLGLTNLPEMSFWAESYNRVYGRTNNPYNLKHTPGGSSGGEAAIVGAGASPFGIGSDIAGSIRMPANFCGVFGHKSTPGLIPMTGHYPMSKSNAHRLNYGPCTYATLGPITRYAEDLSYLLSILQGPDNIDPNTIAPLKKSKPIDLNSLKVYVCESPSLKYCTPVKNEIKHIINRAARHLESLGANLETFDAKPLKNSIELWGDCLSEGGLSMPENLGFENIPINPYWEMFKWFFGKSNHTYPALLFCFLEKLSFTSSSRIQKSIEEAERLRQILNTMLKENHILLFPIQPTPAPKHYRLLFRPLDYGYTAIFNVLKLPATAVPMGLNTDGMPLGLQVIGAQGKDFQIIEIARVLEKEFGGWKVPHDSFTHKPL